MPSQISMDEYKRLAPKRGAQASVNWQDEWFDGNPREFIRQDDFPEMQASSFQVSIREEAKRRGLIMRTSRPNDDTVIAYAEKRS